MSVTYTHVYKRGSNIRARLVDRYGNRRMVDKKFKPELFKTTSDSGQACEFKGMMNDEMLKRIEFKNCYEMDQWIEENKDDRSIEIHGIDNPVFQWITRAFPKEIEFDWRVIRSANVDIEVVSGYRDENGEIIDGPFPQPYVADSTFSRSEKERYIEAVKHSNAWLKRSFPDTIITGHNDLSAAFPVTLIQLSFYDNINDEKYMYVWGLPEPEQRGVYQESGHYEGGYKVDYREFETEQDLLRDFLVFWYKQSFECWTGWNIEGFDNPYISERVRRVLGSEALQYLSPWRDVYGREYVDSHAKDAKKYQWRGCEMLDYVSLYKKHRLITREKYSLDFISHVELNENKLDYEEAKTLTRLYFTNYSKYVDYGKKDIRLVDRLNDKLKYLQVTYALAYLYHCNYSDTLATVSPWTAMMAYSLHRMGYKQRRRKQITDKMSFKGGFVKDVIPGFYRWLFSIDLNSLYPHLFQQWNLGVETHIADRTQRNWIVMDLLDEIEELAGAEKDYFRAGAFKRLAKEIRDGSTDIIQQLIDVGYCKFETLEQHGVCMAPNVEFFRIDKKSFLHVIMAEIYSGRKSDKGKMKVFEQREVWLKDMMKGMEVPIEEMKKSKAYSEGFMEKLQQCGDMNSFIKEMANAAEEQNSFQYAKKIGMNSGYGAVTNNGFRDFFEYRVGEACCAAGRLVNQWTCREVNRFINEDLGTNNEEFWVYSDTDSGYFSLEKLFEVKGLQDLDDNEKTDVIDKYHKEVVAPKIEEISEEIHQTLNTYSQRMFWEREVIAKSAVWQAPKLYIMAITNSEGTAYSTPEIKMQGVAAKKSNYPEWCRDHMKEVYRLCLLSTEEDVKGYVAKVKREYKDLPPQEIAAASAVNDIEKWSIGEHKWRENTPWHVRASISHNWKLAQHPLPTVQPISSGDKVLTLRMIKGAPLPYKTFAFKDFLPEEWDLERYIDKEEMLEGKFLKPIRLILEKMGWSYDNRSLFSKKKTDPTKNRGLNNAQKASKKGGRVQVQSTAKKLF